jgi:hypothetical protein
MLTPVNGESIVKDVLEKAEFEIKNNDVFQSQIKQSRLDQRGPGDLEGKSTKNLEVHFFHNLLA